MIILPQRYRAAAIDKKYLSPKVIFLRLQPSQPVAFVPGQYASFLINGHRRPLSFASLSEEPYLDFLVDISPQGICSKFIQKIQPGDQVEFLAPYGRFVVSTQDQRPLLCVATGTGLAPILPQIHHTLHQQPGRPITLLFGNHDEEHLFFNQELEQLQNHHPNFTYLPVLSSATAHWSGQRGLVTEILPLLTPELAEWTIHICGHPQMVRDVMRLLELHGISRQHIQTEQFTTVGSAVKV